MPDTRLPALLPALLPAPLPVPLPAHRPLRLLFLCGADPGRGTLALGLARQLLGEAVQSRAAAAGAAAPSPLAVEVMTETGVAVAGLRAEALAAVDLGAVDLVVDLCPLGRTPALPAGVSRRHWPLLDPGEDGLAAPALEQRLRYRAARDELHARVLALGRELGLEAAPLPAGGPPLAAVIGWKNAGKTTVVEGLVAELCARGLRVGTVKATHHDVQPDPPGKDSRRHREAGGRETVLVGPTRWVLTHEGAEDPLAAAARMQGIDLVLVEGLRGAAVPKIEVVGAAAGGPEGSGARPVLARTDPDIFLVAADRDPGDLAVPVLPRAAFEALADQLLARLGLLGADPA